MPTWSALLNSVIAGESLSADDTRWAMNQIMLGEVTSAQIAGLVVALRAKGETVAEVSGFATAMLDHSMPIDVEGRAVDVVGTGGDRAHTVNVSTMASIVAAAAGARVVKHGNRAASSACGAADVLEELGVVLDLPPDENARVLEEAGIAFCFAPLYHPSFKHAAGPRRELGVPTLFNFLGPLTNPARPQAMAVGVFDQRMAGIMAGVFAERGDSALVFRGDDGLDELTTATTSTVWVVRDGAATRTTLDPSDLGVPRSGADALRGGDAAFNAAAVRDLVGGKSGPVRDAVLINAAAALVAYDGAGGELVESMRTAYARAAAAIDSGAAADLLDRWTMVTRAHRP